jgi:hypothetical protein
LRLRPAVRLAKLTLFARSSMTTVSVQTLVASVNGLVGGLVQVKTEVQQLKASRALPQDDRFILVMEVRGIVWTILSLLMSAR